MKAQGHAAEVRWGYHKAATLGPWSCAFSNGKGTFEARVVNADAFKVAQSPLTVVIPAQPSPWRWALEDVQITGDRLTGRVARGGK